jgi:hypothetical protein
MSDCRATVSGMSHDIDITELKVALIRAGKRQWQVAVGIGMNPSTLSNMLAGKCAMPPSVRTMIEGYLELPDGALQRKDA